MPPRFLQIHTLTSYPAALLNRDDAGFAKRIPFGGRTRTRISSQCLKRHWRSFEGQNSLNSIGLQSSIRSRLTFERFIYQPLVDGGIDKNIAHAATVAVMEQVLGKSAKAKQNEEDGAGLQTGQLTVLGRPEVDYLLSVAQTICSGITETDPKKLTKAVKAAAKVSLNKESKKNLAALGKAAKGLDAALFGRMVTSDILSRGDAALHVAHAFTVHAEESESDYFSAVDDLLEEMGSAHIGSTELTSGLYYGYVVIDIPLLVSNLEGCAQDDWLSVDRALAGQVIDRIIKLIATVSPGAKLGSTAPYSYAHAVLVEAGDSQPRSLANAFLKPVRARDDLLSQTYTALQDHITDLNRVYGQNGERQVVGLGPLSALREEIGAGDEESLNGIAAWAAAKVV
jgi:CRISPR system Cascade subunit CasC